MLRGGEVKSDSLSRESKVQMTWNSGLHFYLFRKLNWRELTSVPPNIAHIAQEPNSAG